MRARDRRGPLTAAVLFAGYAMLLLSGILWLAGALDIAGPRITDPFIAALLIANLAGFAWRAVMRLVFTMREYGWREGVRAVLRIPLANVIAIMAGRRALGAYVRALRGTQPVWEKTSHDLHPAVALPR